MTNRILRATLIALFCSAAVARAELGADTEASVLFTQAFPAALLPAFAAGWAGAPAFGSAAPRQLAVAAGTVALALVLALGAGWLATGMAPADLALRLAAAPLGWGAAVAGFAVPQLLAWHQAQPRGRRR
ncbi:MAG: hypothetical protein RIR62_2095 [Pseudomonadota bacterium]|jgi:uncharacterized membrane protein (DUF485 family)